MNVRTHKTMLWTATLVLLCAVAAVMRLEWAIFWVPGLILMGYGVLRADRADKISVHDPVRTDLH